MASFRKRSGKWQARINKQGFPPQVKTFLLKAEAERWARKVEQAMDAGAFQTEPAPDTPSVGAIIKRYADEVCPTKRGGSVEVIRLAALGRTSLAEIELDKLTAPAIATYRDERLKQVSAPTVRRELELLSALLNHARQEWNLPVPDAVRGVRRPPPSRGRNRVLLRDEEARLIDALTVRERNASGQWDGMRNQWIKPLVLLALATAMRRGELLALRWEHINLLKRTAHLPVTKNGHSRNVPLSSAAVAVLETLPRTLDGQVFPVTVHSLKKAFERARLRAGLPDLHFHDLRHTAVSRLATKLPNAIELALVSGHRDPRMLMRYYHVPAEELARKIG